MRRKTYPPIKRITEKRRFRQKTTLMNFYRVKPSVCSVFKNDVYALFHGADICVYGFLRAKV